MKVKREKFTTTLQPDLKKKLGILAAEKQIDRNQYIEQLIAREWEELINGIQNNKRNK